MKSLVKILIFTTSAVLVAALIAFILLPLPGQIPVLMYHFIGDAEHAAKSKNYVLTQSFENQMKFLKNCGYRVLSMDEYYATLTGQRESEGREIVITFDDGYIDNYECAFPVLKSLGFKATIFCIATQVGQEHFLYQKRLTEN